MGKFNRFAPLKGAGGEGFAQVGKATEYKKGDYQLLGKGLCAATSIGWLADGKVPKTDEELAELNALQKYYEKQLEETDSDDAALHLLATKFGLQVVSTWPEINNPASEVDKLDKSIDYWDQFGTFGEKVSMYINGELTTKPPRSPFLIGVYLDALEYDIESEATLNNRKLLSKALNEFTGAHAVALKRYMRADGDDYYKFFDPNAGVYQIEEYALKDFFDTVYFCYGNFYAEEMKRRRKSGAPYTVKGIQMDLKLSSFYAIRTR